ncbi:hypothetical protein [Streptomyces seoulensis]|uniref:hypothetical protein n=1 Tax=Streptomyces seoulensis TaxID=73044 RepID=UPI003C2F14C7
MRGGFTATIEGEKTKFPAIATTGAPQSGDEGTALTLTMAAMTAGQDYQVPADVIGAQVAKLG